jgi:sarcosine oxidase subunit gamma
VSERIYAFEPLAAIAATEGFATPGVTLTPLRPRAMLNVRGAPRDAAAVMLDRLGVTLPLEPNTATGTGETRALWLGPDEWLTVSAASALPTPAAADDVTFVDVSHGRAVVRLSGPHVRDTLAKGCTLDLHPEVFTPGRCAQSAHSRVSVILDHVQPGVFDLYCPRSYAGSVWHWLAQAGAEYGCGIDAPPG